MMNKRTTFLTEKEFDKKSLIDVLRKCESSIHNNEDLMILKTILGNFSRDDFSLLSPQEIHFLQTNNQNLWCEYLIFRYKFKTYPEKQIVYDFPIYLLIEPVSSCNLRCIMCFQTDDKFSKNQNFMGQMDIDLFKKIIDEAYAGGTKAITLASRGEPTLHPKLGEMLDYCSNKFFELKLNTNATRLNEKLIHQILKSGVTDMVFSIDSYTKDEYESIRIRGVFEQVFTNIKKFKETRDKFYPNSRCATRVSGVKINDKQDPIKFKEFWEKYVDHVVMVEMEQKWDTYNNSTAIGGHNPCYYLWQEMDIWFDGICNPCDIDYKSELAVGSVKNNTIREIWHGEKYSKIRAAHQNRQRNTCYPCDRCPVGN